MNDKWKIQKHSTVDKYFHIYDPEDRITIMIDFDDVDHKDVNRRAKEIVEKLNKE